MALMVRHKNRFLVVHVTPEKQSVARSLTDRSIHAALQLTIQQLFGERGLGEAGALQVRGLDPHTGLCVVRSSRGCAREVWAALTMTTKVGSDRIACRVLHNAGSARTLRLPALAIFRKKLAHVSSSLGESECENAAENFTAMLASFEA